MEFDDVVKSGRTHLMDAVPVTLGQEFAGYAAQVRAGHRARRSDALPRLGQIPLGGTAVGTGLNTHPEFAARVRASSRGDRASRSRRPPTTSRRRPPRRDRRGLRRAEDRRRLADEDRERPPLARLRPARRPRRDLLPELQKGSSIMPGKVNPVIPEVVTPGRRAGDRQRRGDHDRRHAGPLRAERLRAADRPQHPRLGQACSRARPGSSRRSASTGSRPTRATASATPSSRCRRPPRSTRTSATTRRRRS